MRRTFGQAIYEQMQVNERIVIITGDLGFVLFDRHRRDFPDRFYNVGAAEQAMIGVAVGLALSGKIPFVYSITPFLLYRPFESIRNYLDHEGIPVKLIGSGRDRDYSHDGFSHWAEDDREIMKNFKNIYSFWPEEKEDVPGLIETVINNNHPFYINLRR